MLVDNLDMFLIQPKGSGKFEVPELQLTKSTKRGINLNMNSRDVKLMPTCSLVQSDKSLW